MFITDDNNTKKCNDKRMGRLCKKNLKYFNFNLDGTHYVTAGKLWCTINKIKRESFIFGFEVLTVVAMKISVFWDIMLCRPTKVVQHFIGTYHLHLRCRRVSQVRNQLDACPILFFFSCFDLMTLKMEAVCFSRMVVDFFPDYMALYPSKTFQSRTLWNIEN
jgi:hypothetical protein